MMAALENAILFNVDCEKGEGIELAKKYEIRGFPTYIAMNGEGEVTDSWIGYEGAEKWSASVTAAKADRRTITEKREVFKTEPNLALALALASDAATGSEYKAAVVYYDQALELDPANAGEYRNQILMSMIYGIEDESFSMDDVIAKAEPVMASQETPVTDKLELALMLKYFAGKTGHMDKAVPFIASAWDASEGSTDEEVIKYRDYLEVSHALLVEKDSAKAFDLYREKMPEGWQEDPEQLNKIAWWCFENNVNLEEAQDLAAKGIELAEVDQEKANLLDTAAEICTALGNCDEALAKIQKAVELEPDNEHFQEQLVRFEKAVEDKKKG